MDHRIFTSMTSRFITLETHPDHPSPWVIDIHVPYELFPNDGTISFYSELTTWSYRPSIYMTNLIHTGESHFFSYSLAKVWHITHQRMHLRPSSFNSFAPRNKGSKTVRDVNHQIFYIDYFKIHLRCKTKKVAHSRSLFNDWNEFWLFKVPIRFLHPSQEMANVVHTADLISFHIFLSHLANHALTSGSRRPYVVFRSWGGGRSLLTDHSMWQLSVKLIWTVETLVFRPALHKKKKPNERYILSPWKQSGTTLKPGRAAKERWIADIKKAWEKNAISISGLGELSGHHLERVSKVGKPFFNTWSRKLAGFARVGED